jgi:hypothetical protein
MNKRSWLALVGGILLYALTVVLVRQTFTSQVPGANDFYSRWKGAQLFVVEGLDPYSEEASLEIQIGMYGRPALPDEDQVLFVYPFYTIFTIWPLVWLPYDWVQAIWLVTLMGSMLAGVYIILQLLDWRPSLWLLAVIMIWTVLNYNSVRTIILGQYAGLIFLWLMACLVALRRRADLLAGALLALTTIKPQMVFLVIPALLLWALWQRRWRFVAGFTSSMIILVGLSFLLLPGWMVGFIEQASAYPGYTFTGSPLWVITGHYFPQLGTPVENLLIVLFMIYLLVRGRSLLGESTVSTEFLIVISLTLILANMIVVRTATTNYIVMYLPLFLGLQAVSRASGKVVVAALLLSMLVGFWWLFLATISGDTEAPINYLPLPVVLMIMLVWGGDWLRRDAGPGNKAAPVAT